MTSFFKVTLTEAATPGWSGVKMEPMALRSLGSSNVSSSTAADSWANCTDNCHLGTASNNGSSNFTAPWMEADGSQPMPTYAQVIITVMYSTITVMAIGGNLIVCYTVLAYQRMRTVTNYFIVNLAVSDLLMAALCIPFTFVANLLIHYWPFGGVMCPLVTYAQMVTVFLSAFTLVAISLDRYVAIIYPLQPRMTKTMAILVIALIWFLALLVPLPVAILSRLITRVDHVGTNRSYCDEVWPGQQQRYIYSMAIMVLQYFLPLAVLLFTYTRIGIVIWVKRTPGEAENNRDQRMAAAKRKMVKMMITVVIIYALCWLPLHTITLIGDSHPTVYDFEHIQVVWIACHWLAMSNCCYNPMVYCWMNSRFRNGFRYVLRFCPCVMFDADEHDPKKVKMLHTYVSTVKSEKRMLGGVTPSPTSSTVTRGNYTMFTSYSQEQIPLGKVAVTNGFLKRHPSSRVSDQGYASEDTVNGINEKVPLSFEE